VTLSEKHAVAKFGIHLAAARGDVEQALEIFERHCARDYKKHGDVIRRMVKAATK
jgi:hypothetical protein